MSDKKEPVSTWDQIKHLSLSNQVKAICESLDESLQLLRESIPETPKPDKK